MIFLGDTSHLGEGSAMRKDYFNSPSHNRAFPLETNKYQGGNYTAIHNTGSVSSYHLALAQ